jgi:hypothetical protein
MLHQRKKRFAAITILLALAGGCASGPKNEPPPEGISVDATDSDLLDFGPPQVSIEKGVLIVEGTVTRKPGDHDVIAGRIDIDVVASNGENLAWLTALLTPDPVPDDDKGQSTYMVRYGLVPPAGSTEQVHIVDKATATQEDIDEREYGSGGYGGGGGGHGGGHGNGGGHHGHMGW